jgi:hypothetical protein
MSELKIAILVQINLNLMILKEVSTPHIYIILK